MTRFVYVVNVSSFYFSWHSPEKHTQNWIGKIQDNKQYNRDESVTIKKNQLK